ncbi:Cytochrome P450 CYP72A219 [Vitis vinifera]|uniref:Cytochrome P450 CYP72A219 n=1 Tax=Vitis vinifera TaxID=29760 RepID=A0A438BMH1_VITVI|nr:Cytochrome P450 CYP72A219 [Vitis vinifera]
MKQLNLVALSFAFITILIYAWRVLNWMWLRPKRLERCLKQQGLAGNSYRLSYGDFKEMSMMIKEATSRPISISDDILQRVVPFHYRSIKKYGKHMDF